MSISSAQPSYSITLNDTITIDTSSWSSYNIPVSSTDTITLTGAVGTAADFNPYSSGVGVIAQDIGSISGTTFTWKMPEEFVDTLPDISRIEAMCEQYPGLKIAYEKFVTTYKLVKDHYDTPEDQRPKP
jgi:hypothetical protein